MKASIISIKKGYGSMNSGMNRQFSNFAENNSALVIAQSQTGAILGGGGTGTWDETDWFDQDILI